MDSDSRTPDELLDSRQSETCLRPSDKTVLVLNIIICSRSLAILLQYDTLADGLILAVGSKEVSKRHSQAWLQL